MSDFDALVVRLRRWTHDHDPHVRAAVELLIWHEIWIRRADFQRACIEWGGREAYIDWRKAREFTDAGARRRHQRWPSSTWPWRSGRTGSSSRSWARPIRG